MNITKLAAALVKAQAEMGGAKKDSDNPFFKSKYADLSSVAAAIGPAAAKFGLGYVQIAHNIEGHAAIETIIIHESGETLPCGIMSVPVMKATAQEFGSATTYARRFSLSAAFGVCPEDDDGNAASKTKAKNTPTQQMTDEFDSLDKDQQKAFMAVVETVRAQLDQGNVSAGYDLYAEFRDTLEDVAHQAALRSLFSSAERSALQKENASRKEKK